MTAGLDGCARTMRSWGRTTPRNSIMNLDPVNSQPHIQKHQPLKMVLPLEEYRAFFTQNPETDQSSHDSAAEPNPHRTQCLKNIVETTKAAWTSSRDDASDDIAALAEIAADACRQRKIPLHAAANSSL